MLQYNDNKPTTSFCFAKHCFPRRPTWYLVSSGFLSSRVSPGLSSVWSVITHLEFSFQSKGVNPQPFSLTKFHLTYFYVSLLIRDHFLIQFLPYTVLCTLLVFRLSKGVNSLSSVEEKSSCLLLNIITKESTLWCCVISPGTKGKLGSWQVITTWVGIYPEHWVWDPIFTTDCHGLILRTLISLPN